MVELAPFPEHGDPPDPMDLDTAPVDGVTSFQSQQRGGMLYVLLYD